MKFFLGKKFLFILGILLAYFMWVTFPAHAINFIEDFSHPESITIDSTGQRIFVSNIGANMEPSSKDGDGFISEITANGKLVHKSFTPKGALNAPKGLAVADNILYVADIDRIVGFDLESGKQVSELDLSSRISFINDLLALNEQTLLASASDTGKIYQVSLADNQVSVLHGCVPGANGITYDTKTNTIYAVGLGKNFNGKGGIYELELSISQSKFERIDVPTGFFDGIAYLDEKYLIYSNWVGIQKPTQGAIYIYNINTKKLDKLKLPIKVHGPADFYYQATTNLLWLPLTLDNRVAILKLNKILPNFKKY
ncbi:hypothetical protein [Chlorogloeopsis sp. ULAP02]|uniref:SMP-30/gluconolactonase/LRE family protein n=1 Tax=Chlorogloeopsis sp. ULAP02 TaxID=3107926 RepID=UPI0031359EFA